MYLGLGFTDLPETHDVHFSVPLFSVHSASILK